MEILVEEYLKSTIKTYDEIANDYVNITSAIRPQLEFDSFCQYLPMGARILDVGCAWGRDSQAFREAGFNPVGVDLSINMLGTGLKISRQQKFLQADLRYLPLTDKFVDGIWCVATLLHLKRKEIVRSLKEFHRVLKEGGVCYIQVKHGDGEETVGGSFSKGKERYFSYFTEDEIKNYCLLSGLHIIESHTYNEKDRNGPNSRDQIQICFSLGKPGN
jgi:ubiquinone/menaquinone biosynthesis C-methylase UbiE